MAHRLASPPSAYALVAVTVVLCLGVLPLSQLFALAIILFPYGEHPAGRWRWLMGTIAVVRGVWMISAFAIAAETIALGRIVIEPTGDLHQIAYPTSGWASLLVLPLAIGIGITKYRLYDIDPIISRTLAYPVLTALFVGVFVGVVLLATRALPFSSPVGVAASTLAAASLSTLLRNRLQCLVDCRFNRARYDAEALVAGFVTSLRDAVDPETVLKDLSAGTARSLQPAPQNVWVKTA